MAVYSTRLACSSVLISIGLFGLIMPSNSPLVSSQVPLMESIIPPWLDPYGATPNITLTIIFNNSFIFNNTMVISQQTNNGQLLTLSQASVQPQVRISGPSLDPHASYTFITIDPDAFTPSNPVIKNAIHWIISNIPGSTLPSQDIANTGTIVLNYLKPARPFFNRPPPPYGVHRFYNLLFKQKHRHENVQNITTSFPSFFDTRNFTQKYKLGYPMAGVVFNVDADS